MKDSLPPWLPALVRLEDFDGDAVVYIKNHFEIFSHDFIEDKPEYNGLPVLFDKADENGKPRAFNHITTDSDRITLDLRRCERIGWIRPIIENVNDPAILFWNREHFAKSQKSNRLYFFLECDNFLVILEEKKKGHFMITAIYVDNPHQKQKHLKAYEEYKTANNS